MKLPLGLGVFTFILTVIAIILFLTFVPQYQSELIEITKTYPFLAPFIIISWRIIAIIIPPLPGGVLSFAFIPIIGWFWAYVYSEIGVLIGASLAFYIARKFREPVASRFVPIQSLHAWEEKLSSKKEFFAFLGIRIAAASVMDFISFAAGLSKMSYKKFILATAIAELPLLVWYYFGEVAYDQYTQKSGLISGVIIVIALIVVMYFVRNHGYLKKKNVVDIELVPIRKKKSAK